MEKFRIENIRLLPFAVCGCLQIVELEGNKSVFKWMTEEPKGVEFSADKVTSILADNKSQILLICLKEEGVKAFHITDKIAIKVAVEIVKSLHPQIKMERNLINNSEAVDFRRQRARTIQQSNTDRSLEILNAFSKVKQGYFNAFSKIFSGTGENEVRPKIQNAAMRNPWIVDRPLNLPPSRIDNSPHSNSLVEAYFSTYVARERRLSLWEGLLIVGDREELRVEFGRIKELIGEEEQQRKFEETIGRIQKDLNRVDCLDEDMLFRLLQCYCFYDDQIEYVQGMADLLAPIIHLDQSRDESLIFWLFVGLMKRVRGNFLKPDESVHSQLTILQHLLKLTSPILYDFLSFNEDSVQLFFAYRWLLVLYRREFTMRSPDEEGCWLVWDKLFLRGIDFGLFVSLAMILKEKDLIMERCHRFEDLVRHFHQKAFNNSWNPIELVKFADQLEQYVKLWDPVVYNELKLVNIFQK